MFLPLGVVSVATGTTDTLVDNNDNFADAFDLTGAALPHVVRIDSSSATMEPGEPTSCGGESHSVWYKFTAATRQGFETIFDGLGQLMVVYTLYSGTALDNLQQVACAARGIRTSDVQELAAGTTYYIRFAHYDDSAGGEFDVSLTNIDLMPNDDFANATPVTGNFEVTLDNRFLTFEEGEPTDCQFHERTAWYRYDAAQTGTLVFEGVNTGYLTMAAAYSGTALDNLELIECRGGTFLSGYPYIDFRVEAGQSYYLKSATYYTQDSIITLRGTLVPPAPNDDFANATVITTPGADSLRVEDAGREAGEPQSCAWDETVWYRYTPTANGTLVVRTDASTFGVDSAIWVGDSVDQLTEVACNMGHQRVDVRANVEAGTTYHIQLGGGSGGLSRLDATFDWYETPANDAFADALELTGNPVSADANTIGATWEDNEAYGCDFTLEATRWYSYTAATDDTLRITLAGSQTSTDVVVYRGPASNLVVQEESCYSTDGHVQFTPVAGTKYWIQVDADNEQRGPATLTVSQHPRPSHDDLETPLDVTTPLAMTVDTRGATTDSSDPGACTGVRSSLWYRFDVPELSWYTFGGSSPTIRPTTALYRDEADPTYLACSGEYWDEDLHDSDRLLTPGSYLMRVGHPYGYSSDDVYITLAAVDGPPNDDFANATLITEGVEIASTMKYATYEEDENRDPCNSGVFENTNTVWHKFVASRDGIADLTSSYYRHALYFEDNGELVLQECAFNRAPVTQGETYWIQTGRETLGHWENHSFTLQVDIVDPTTGDMVADAIAVPLPGPVTLTVPRGTTREVGEARTCPAGGSTWYTFTVPRSAWARFDLPNNWGYHVGLLTGDSLESLEEIHCFPYSSRGVQFEDVLEAGQTYYLKVNRWSNNVADLVVNLELLPRPVNDLLRHARSLNGVVEGPVQFATTTQSAVPERNEPRPCIREGIRTVWYRYDADAAGVLNLDTTGSSFDTQIAAYRSVPMPEDTGPIGQIHSGSTLGWNDLQKVGCADLPNGGERLAVPVAAGQPVYVQVSGIDGRWGNLVLDASLDP